MTNAPMQLDRPIVLVGLMGAGKTSIGRRLASRLKLPFRDADHAFEEAAGCTVAEYFERFGEASFREGERRVIARLLQEGPQVLATGGGAFMDADTRATILGSAVSVWLRAELDVLVERTSRRNTRPLLRQGDPREVLARLIDQRYPVYAQADIVVDSVQVPPNEMVSRVIRALRAYEAARRHGGEQAKQVRKS